MPIGMTRPIDGLGRIVLPKELRQTLDWKQNDRLVICTHTENGEPMITLQKQHSTCVICGKSKHLKPIPDTNKLICQSCIQQLAKP